MFGTRVVLQHTEREQVQNRPGSKRPAVGVPHEIPTICHKISLLLLPCNPPTVLFDQGFPVS